MKINIEWISLYSYLVLVHILCCMCVCCHTAYVYQSYIPFISFLPNCGDRTSVYGLFNTQFPIHTTVQNLDIHFTHSIRTLYCVMCMLCAVLLCICKNLNLDSAQTAQVQWSMQCGHDSRVHAPTPPRTYLTGSIVPSPHHPAFSVHKWMAFRIILIFRLLCKRFNSWTFIQRCFVPFRSSV